MKRRELQTKLESLIPTFNTEGFVKTMLVEEITTGMPWNLKRAFGEGITIELNLGSNVATYTSKYVDGRMIVNEKLAAEKCGRRVLLDAKNDNGVYSGTLIILGPKFTCENGGSVAAPDLIKKYPLVQSSMMNIMRIDNGEKTSNFNDLKELVSTAMWVALDRVKGSFHFEVGSLIDIPPSDIIVNDKGVVTVMENSRYKKLVADDGIF